MSSVPGRRSGSVPWPWITALGLAILLLWLQTSLYPKPFSCDDAFIAFRYAANASRGHGLVFNPGEAVEGYTSFLWVVLLAAANLLGAGLPPASRLLGALFSSASLVLVALWPLRLGSTGQDWKGLWLWGGLSALTLASCHALAYHSTIGLETTFTAFLLTLAMVLTDWQHGIIGAGAGAAYLLVLLTRPEAVVWFGTAAVVCWTLRRASQEGPFPWRYWTRGPALAAGGFALFLVWRLAYYGQLLPNTYFAKRGYLPDDLHSGASYLASWISGGPGLIVAAAILVLALRRRRNLLVWSLPMLTIHLVSVVWTGGDFMWLWRFMLPFLPLEAVLVARAVLDLPDLVSRGSPKWKLLATPLFLAIVMAGLAVPGLKLSRTIREVYSRYDRKWIVLGRQLAGRVTPHTTIALSPVGAIPFYTGARAIDVLGLTGAHIARTPVDRRVERKGHQHHDGHWVLAQRPDLLILGNGIVVDRRGAPADQLLWYPELAVTRNWRVQRGPYLLWPSQARMLTYEEDIWEDPLFARWYAADLLPLKDGLFLLVWRRRGVP